jgi:hypothetical protein
MSLVSTNPSTPRNRGTFQRLRGWPDLDIINDLCVLYSAEQGGTRRNGALGRRISVQAVFAIPPQVRLRGCGFLALIRDREWAALRIGAPYHAPPYPNPCTKPCLLCREANFDLQTKGTGVAETPTQLEPGSSEFRSKIPA